MTCHRLRRSEKSQSLRIGSKLHRMVHHYTHLSHFFFKFQPPSRPKGDFSYLRANFDKIRHKWPSHQWEMTDTVKLMITHIFRPSHPPLLSQNLIFSIYGPIFIQFDTNGPCSNWKWLIQLYWWSPIFSGPLPPPKLYFSYLRTDFD